MKNEPCGHPAVYQVVTPYPPPPPSLRNPLGGSDKLRLTVTCACGRIWVIDKYIGIEPKRPKI